jgi:4-hydroxy-tetrahydrodipicolinate synthase
MTSDLLRGVCPIIDTPFTDDGAVHYDDLEALTATLAEACDAVALFGFASEFYKLTDAERERMAELVVDTAAAAGTPSVCSVTAQSTPVAVEEAQRFEAMGADALMILPPYVRDPPVGAVMEHIETVARAVSIPMMVQYAPGSTGMTIQPETLADLYDAVDTIEYFKIECDPAGPYIDTLHECTDGEATTFVGRAGYEMIDGYDRGAVGVMPASAMYDVYVDIDRHYRAGNRDDAIEVHADLVAFLNQLTRVGIAAEKRVLARRGLSSTEHCRRPEATFDADSAALFDEHYDQYLAPHLSTPASTKPPSAGSE